MRFERDPTGSAVYGQGILRDITELKEAELELRRLNAVLSAQFENSPDGIVVVETATKTTTYNRRFVEMWSMPSSLPELRYTDESLAVMSAQLKYPEQWLASVHHAEAYSDVEFDEDLELKDGRVYERHSGPIRDLDGTRHGRIIFFRDITQRKRAEEALLESERRFRTVTDTAQDAIIMIDSTGYIRYWNRAAETITGYSEEEAIGGHIHELLAPASYRDAAAEGLARLRGRARGQSWAQSRNWRRSARMAPKSQSSSPSRPPRSPGSVTRSASCATSVTQAGRGGLARGRSAVRLALDAGHMRAWEWDASTNMVSWLSELKEAGSGPEMLVQTSAEFITDVYPDDRKIVLQAIAQALRGDGDYNAEYRRVRADGSHWWVESRARLFRDRTGNPARLMGLATDISKRKQAENDLRYRDEILHAMTIGASRDFD